MIKNILRITKIIIALGSLIINMNIVLGEENEYYISKRRFNNTYAVYNGPDRVHLFYAQSYVINNEQAYCIEPGLPINDSYYYKTDDLSLSGLNEETLKKIRIIGYYGFNYPGHTNNRYYMAAQEMIWKEITGRDTYWVSEENVNGPRINIDEEKRNILELINNHYKVPSFDNQEIVIEVGKPYTLKDESNVLSKFKIYEAKIDNIKIENNRITITPKSINDSSEIKLISNLYTDKVSFIYYKGDNQKLMSSTGVLEPIISSFKIKVIDKPYIKLTKIDEDSNKPIYLKGIKFKIKNIDTNEYICENEECTYITDDKGTFITNNKFAYGNYQVEEIDDQIKGYLWNKEPLLFTIDENSIYKKDNDKLYLELKFKNKAVTGSLELLKVGERPLFNNNILEYTEYNLSDVVFNLYAKDNIYNSDNTIIYKANEFINTYKTTDGLLHINNLPLGSYYLKEVSTAFNHILDKENHYFTIDYIDQYTSNIIVKIKLKNYLAKGTFEFLKIASETGLPLENTKIALYNNQDELLFTDYTNSEGKIIIEGLPLGKYYIEELEAPKGYTLSKEKINFEIKHNNEFISTTMENTLINVPSTNLNKEYYSYIISGIIFIIGLLLFIYEKK